MRYWRAGVRYDRLDSGSVDYGVYQEKALPAEERAAGSADAVHDLLRRLGDLSTEEVAARVRGADVRARERAAGEWLEGLGGGGGGWRRWPGIGEPWRCASRA